VRVRELYNHYHPIEVDHTTPYEEKVSSMKIIRLPTDVVVHEDGRVVGPRTRRIDEAEPETRND
jgi:hypothetical protein